MEYGRVKQRTTIYIVDLSKMWREGTRIWTKRQEIFTKKEEFGSKKKNIKQENSFKKRKH